MSNLNAIDVSAYSTSLNMAAAAGRYSSVIIKATEGSGDDLNNPYFAGPDRNDWAASRAAGLVRGAYHVFYARPGSSTPKAQADHFLGIFTDFRAGDLPPAIDLEPVDPKNPARGSFRGLNDPAAAEAAVLEWLDLVETALTARVGKAIKPFIYANPSVITDDMANPASLAAYPLYLADFNAVPAAPAPWANQDIVIWQYAENQHVPGVTNDCDFCQFSLFQNGSQGKAVKMIQGQLIASGYLAVGGDSAVFDNNTDTAVRAFQTAQHLTVDGVVGARTWAALQWA